MKLRRENVGMYAKSCFQNKLCDVLYEGSSIPNNFFMINEDALAFLKEEKDAFLNEVCFFNLIILMEKKLLFLVLIF